MDMDKMAVGLGIMCASYVWMYLNKEDYAKTN